MERLQSQFAVLLFLTLLLGCGQDRREEVAERYSTGQKKEVRVYEGEGTEEKLIKRQIYTRGGELIRVENVAKGDTLYYDDLNPGLVDPEGLENYLTEKAWTPGKESSQSFQFTSDSMFMADGSVDGLPVEAWIHHVEYLSGGKIVRHKDTETDTLRVFPAGPDSSIIGFVSFKRAKRDVQQAARKYRKQQKRFETASQKVTLGPRGNQMMYDQDEFTVSAGETVELAYENTATSPSMQHNVLVLNAPPEQDIFMKVGQAAVRAGASKNYVPGHDAVIAATPIAKPGERVSVTFRAPEEPGTYGFMCTFPGHWATGQGTMQVVSE